MTRAKASPQCIYILHLRQQIDASLDIFIAGDEILHFAVVELAVGDHIEVAGACEAEDDVLGFVVMQRIAAARQAQATVDSL